MALRYLLPKGGQFYKANLHCHSTCSDGFLSPQALKAAYKARGYHIIAYTDHRVCVDHQDLCDDQFLALNGSELDDLTNAEETGWQKACHICAISQEGAILDPMIQLLHGGPDAFRKTIRQLSKNKFIVHYNHPVWSAHCTSDFLPLKEISGFEIYNHCSQVYGMEGDAIHEFMLFLKNGNRAYPVAADDNHNQPHKYRRVSDSFGGFNIIKAPELTYNSIIAALLQGHTYASTGPEIYEYVLDGMRLSITCSPVAKAILKTSSIGLNSQNFRIMDFPTSPSIFQMPTGLLVFYCMQTMVPTHVLIPFMKNFGALKMAGKGLHND